MWWTQDYQIQIFSTMLELSQNHAMAAITLSNKLLQLFLQVYLHGWCLSSRLKHLNDTTSSSAKTQMSSILNSESCPELFMCSDEYRGAKIRMDWQSLITTRQNSFLFNVTSRTLCRYPVVQFVQFVQLPQRRLHHHHLQRHHPVALLRQHLPGSSGSKFPPFLQISTSHLQSRSSPKSPKLDLPQQLSLLLHTFSHHLFDLVQAPANKLTLDLLSCAKVWKMWSLDHGFGLWMTTGLSLCILFVSTYMVYIIKIHISISTCKMLLGTVAWGETSRLWLRPRWKVTTSSACSHSIIPQPQRLRRSCHSYFQLGRRKRPT